MNKAGELELTEFERSPIPAATIVSSSAQDKFVVLLKQNDPQKVLIPLAPAKPKNILCFKDTTYWVVAEMKDKSTHCHLHVS